MSHGINVLNLTTQNDNVVMTGSAYSLVFCGDRPFVRVFSSGGDLITELFVFSSVHPLNGRDETYEAGEWIFRDIPGGMEACVAANSTAWASKLYRFSCFPDRFTYTVEVEGHAELAEALYFGGYYSASLRWSSGFFWSGQEFRQVFNPEPNVPEVFHHHPGSTTKIDLMGVPLPAKGDWFFTPPPFCFAGDYGNGWLALGVEARPGENLFSEYHYHGSLKAFYLSLSYEGHTQVRGRYVLPAIGFDFAADEYQALAAHVSALKAAGFAPTVQREETPAWWRTPIFCGWGSQCYLAELDGGKAPDYARQMYYERFLEALEENRLQPGIVVLDDKWQATYGENLVDETKWPDLRGFIERQHQAGRRVLLWLKAWDPEGVPVEECVTHQGGGAVAVDPTNPAYERRLRAAVRRMLSTDGYNADGFKIDFSARIPSGPGLRSFGRVWGLELMKRYLDILYSEAKLVKPDALIMAHTPHPYLADMVDMIRLNDINVGQDVVRAMRHRARVATIALPHAIIDTDNWPVTDRQSWRDYLAVQTELGVPSLYYSTHIDRTREPLEASDYELIRESWSRFPLADLKTSNAKQEV